MCYKSPSKILRSARRITKFIEKKPETLSSVTLTPIDIPPCLKALKFCRASNVDIYPPKKTLTFTTLARTSISPVQPEATRVTARARRRCPPQPSIPGSVTHCCVCWQPFTDQSPQFHCICGSIPCLDCLGDHTCRIWRKFHPSYQHHSFVSPHSYLKFLAAMSSSRGDDITPSVRPSVHPSLCPSVRPFVHRHFFFFFKNCLF